MAQWTEETTLARLCGFAKICLYQIFDCVFCFVLYNQSYYTHQKMYSNIAQASWASPMHYYYASILKLKRGLFLVTEMWPFANHIPVVLLCDSYIIYVRVFLVFFTSTTIYQVVCYYCYVRYFNLYYNNTMMIVRL